MSSHLSGSLIDRLNAIRAAHNTCSVSKDTTPTSLETFVRLYNKAGKECFLDYMAGAKALYKYLSPVEIPDSHPRVKYTSYGLYNMYTTIELTYVILGSKQHPDFARVQDLIVYYTAKHILEDV